MIRHDEGRARHRDLDRHRPGHRGPRGRGRLAGGGDDARPVARRPGLRDRRCRRTCRLDVTDAESIAACFEHVRDDVRTARRAWSTTPASPTSTRPWRCPRSTTCAARWRSTSSAWSRSAGPRCRCCGPAAAGWSPSAACTASSGQPFNEAYAAAKFAVEGFMESLAPVAAAHGVEVSIVVPGFVSDTEFGRFPDINRRTIQAASGPYADTFGDYFRLGGRGGLGGRGPVALGGRRRGRRARSRRPATAVPGAHQPLGRARTSPRSSPTSTARPIQSLARTWVGAAPSRPPDREDHRCPPSRCGSWSTSPAATRRSTPTSTATCRGRRRADRAAGHRPGGLLDGQPLARQPAADRAADRRGRLQLRRHHRHAEVLAVDAHRARRLHVGLRRGHGPGRPQARAPGREPVLRRPPLRRLPLHRGVPAQRAGRQRPAARSAAHVPDEDVAELIDELRRQRARRQADEAGRAWPRPCSSAARTPTRSSWCSSPATCSSTTYARAAQGVPQGGDRLARLRDRSTPGSSARRCRATTYACTRRCPTAPSWRSSTTSTEEPITVAGRARPRGRHQPLPHPDADHPVPRRRPAPSGSTTSAGRSASSAAPTRVPGSPTWRWPYVDVHAALLGADRDGVITGMQMVQRRWDGKDGLLLRVATSPRCPSRPGRPDRPARRRGVPRPPAVPGHRRRRPHPPAPGRVGPPRRPGHPRPHRQARPGRGRAPS